MTFHGPSLMTCQVRLLCMLEKDVEARTAEPALVLDLSPAASLAQVSRPM